MHQAPLFRLFNVRLAVSDMLRLTLTTMSVLMRVCALLNVLSIIIHRIKEFMKLCRLQCVLTNFQCGANLTNVKNDVHVKCVFFVIAYEV